MFVHASQSLNQINMSYNNKLQENNAMFRDHYVMLLCYIHFTATAIAVKKMFTSTTLLQSFLLEATVNISNKVWIFLAKWIGF